MKTHQEFDPRVTAGERMADPAQAEWFEGGQLWADGIRQSIIDSGEGDVVDLRGITDLSVDDQVAACVAALSRGVDAVIGGLLPADVEGHRRGRVDLLVRDGSRPDGRAGYRPVVIKYHLVQERQRSGRDNQWHLDCSPAHTPFPGRATTRDSVVFRNQRAGDLLHAAHFWRMLEASGWSAEAPVAGVVGTDLVDDRPVVTWVDLEVPFLRTFSRSAESGWTRRSVLERYDHEHGFRVQVAAVAEQQQADSPPTPLVQPIVVNECRRCVYWEQCLLQLDADDISLRLDRAPFDVREIGALRHFGIRTITDLAGVDLADFLPRYLPEVSHRRDAESRLRHAAHRADMLVRDVALERITDGPVPVPAGGLEIDFDIETNNQDRVYLWGFRLDDGTYRHFSAWTDLDEQGEEELAVAAMTWLREQVESHESVKIYHYSDYEVVRLRRLADRSGHEMLQWAVDHVADLFVDLYAVVREHWFGVNGLGLKVVATEGAGFHWRDDNPGGLNSLQWFDEAAHADNPATRDEARTRVLEYNEDDVRATAAVREWLRRSE